MKENLTKYYKFVFVLLVLTANVSYAVTDVLCVMSKEDNCICSCIHVSAKCEKQDSDRFLESGIIFSNHNSKNNSNEKCCNEIVKEFSNKADFYLQDKFDLHKLSFSFCTDDPVTAGKNENKNISPKNQISLFRKSADITILFCSLLI